MIRRQLQRARIHTCHNNGMQAPDGLCVGLLFELVHASDGRCPRLPALAISNCRYNNWEGILPFIHDLHYKYIIMYIIGAQRSPLLRFIPRLACSRPAAQRRPSAPLRLQTPLASLQNLQIKNIATHSAFYDAQTQPTQIWHYLISIRARNC